MKSPCVKICVVHPGTGYCVGCNRTLEEIADWARLSEAEQTRIMGELAGRENAHRDRSARPSRQRRRRRQEAG